MTTGGYYGNSDRRDLAAQWGSLCERFHEIRLGAHRYNLIDIWRQLVKAEPDDCRDLAAWRRLDDQINRLADQEADQDVRHGGEGREHSADDGWDDQWDDAGDEYACPVGKCDRRARAPLGIPPRCELFRAEMTRCRDQPDG